MKQVARAVFAAVFALCSATSALSAAYDKFAMPEEAKTVQNGRIVQSLLPQAEIKTNIAGSYVAVAMGGGLLAALIDAEIQKQQAIKAELLVQPIREALAGYDADSKAKGVTYAIAQNVAWLAPKEQSFSRDITQAGQMQVLDATDAAQVGFFVYGYGFNADFASIRVDLTMRIVNKAIPEGKKPEARLLPKNHLLMATVSRVITLPVVTKDKEANAKLWTEQNGARARAALDAAFADLPTLGVRVLNMQEADAAALRKNKNTVKTIGNDQGRVVEEEGSNVLLLTPIGLVRITPLSETAPAAQVISTPQEAPAPPAPPLTPPAPSTPVAPTPQPVLAPPAMPAPQG
jgi:hypothetical protein